jgi:pimeloyl-ACP methyl ester carboxylesterase
VIEGIDVTLVTTRTADGVQLHGAMAGTPATGGILGVHGAWGNFYATPIVEFLRQAADREVLALSLNARSHDLGGMDDGARSVGIMRERLDYALDDLDAARGLLELGGADRYVVVAHSYGCARATYWLSTNAPPGCVGVVLLTPPPTLASTAAFFIDGAIEDHFDSAREAVHEGEPERMIVMRMNGRIPMLAEAATVLSIWGPDSVSRCRLHLPRISLPILVLVGEGEPPVYRDEAVLTTEAAEDATLVILDGEDHYYTRNRAQLGSVVFEWIANRKLFAEATQSH